jgi:hypothetical protein
VSADVWLHDFHEFVRKKSERLAQCELEKGELEAAMMLIGSKVIALFPGDIQDSDQVPTVVVRLFEELSERRKKERQDGDQV